MATPKVRAATTATWSNVIGAASGVAGMTWQNVGGVPLAIAFTAAAPAGGATDARHVLTPGDAFYDKNGSTAAWVQSSSPSEICGTAD